MSVVACTQVVVKKLEQKRRLPEPVNFSYASYIAYRDIGKASNVIKQKISLKKVTEICKVPLAIRKHYNELVTCDVVDMEACHILLGRPWQHDVDATHQGVVSPKKALESKTLVTLVASPKEFQAEK
ncbi:hypothetical protein Tco_0842366 [Tanacetum coccineum]|uniref:Uncharacterized protein n=1 Tax=Tanacetum coccineum TaxID=301880 RepID=A0ABQ5B3F1_9ASTR